MSLHTEIHLEDEVCEYLHAHDWLYATGDAANYDRMLALYPADVVAWVSKSPHGVSHNGGQLESRIRL